MSSVRRSIVLSALERYGILALTLLSIVVLSRLLAPHEFGIFSMTSSIYCIIAAVREFGGANYIIQKSGLTESVIRTAFTINLILSGLAMAFVISIRAPVASFFDEPGLRAALVVISLNFLLAPFWETVTALLRREMAFSAITICNLITTTVLVATSIGLAAVGFSFMAPVWALVASSLTQVILFCTFRRDIRIFLPCFRGWRDVLRFGAYSSGTTLTSTLICGRHSSSSAACSTPPPSGSMPGRST